MNIKTFFIAGPLLLSPPRHSDLRGFFSETFRRNNFSNIEGGPDFVQDNYTLSHRRGTIRGLHFQVNQSAQAKLIHVVRGSIFDIAVDIRKSSPTFGQHLAIEISAENWMQIYIPIGFAHGYCTLEPNTEVMYKTTSYYDPLSEKGLAWNDPILSINWPVASADAFLSEKDMAHPTLASLPAYFP